MEGMAHAPSRWELNYPTLGHKAEPQLPPWDLKALPSDGGNSTIPKPLIFLF